MTAGRMNHRGIMSLSPFQASAGRGLRTASGLLFLEEL